MFMKKEKQRRTEQFSLFVGALTFIQNRRHSNPFVYTRTAHVTFCKCSNGIRHWR